LIADEEARGFRVKINDKWRLERNILSLFHPMKRAVKQKVFGKLPMYDSGPKQVVWLLTRVHYPNSITWAITIPNLDQSETFCIVNMQIDTETADVQDNEDLNESNSWN